MFTSIKNNLVQKKYVKLLAAVVAGTASAAGCAMIAEKDADGMAASEPTFLEVNKAIAKDGTVAVRATAAGIAALAADAGAPLEPAAPKEALSFTLETGFALPVSKRGGVKADIYPFDKMEVGQSFFVAATEKRPHPEKALASTVSSATKRYKATDKDGKPTGKDGRKFTIRARTAGEDGEKASGARIYRIQ